MTAIRLVAIGSSLGGLHALRKLLEPLPPEFGAAMVLAQHRRADADSRLSEILSTFCALPVIEAEDKEPLHPGRLYVAPANYHLMVTPHSLLLTVDPPVWFARPSIDVLFESAAEAFGPGLVAIVLTGANEDGAAGARAVKRAGGIVLVQDPAEAESPVAPRAAIAGASVDAVLPLSELTTRLLRLVPTASGRQREARH
jgi:two-component system, chemotaxis family, protein-glutamate methylesterase/glutaminase